MPLARPRAAEQRDVLRGATHDFPCAGLRKAGDEHVDVALDDLFQPQRPVPC